MSRKSALLVILVSCAGQPKAPLISTPAAKVGGFESASFAQRILPRPLNLKAPQSIEIRAIPARPPHAMTGRQFLSTTSQMSLAQREARASEEILAGNVPTFVRRFVPVPIFLENEQGVLKTCWIFVLPDYLSIGSDDDFVRIPLTPVVAQRIADKFGAQLPTSAIVNAVFDAASIKLKPLPMKPGLVMRTNGYLLKHEDMIAKQLFGRTGPVLVAGHKKDVVVANKHRKGRVTIYGWHTGRGEPIQPLSAWHRESYSDYSHGVRLVSPKVLIGNAEWKLNDVYRHPTLSQMVSFEGPLRNPIAPKGPIDWTAVETRTPYDGTATRSIPAAH